VRTDKDGAPLFGEGTEELSNPTDALGVEAIDRFVKEEYWGSPSKAAAIPNRWLIPSENPPTFLSATDAMPTNSSTSSTRDFLIRFDDARARR